ncbi:hypothetical protein [Spirulina sp. 06S082]|uniref:hypothetical protein n=1 Tax=Spirulina sp. 06S082 TaxID=3110248 RepID=UPI002B1F229D|nr:hypothetical protein [Spirulina sp. 06S082]MEA5471284.1 hypothetical protein [Spirulina sp. 06S082]
MKRSYLIYHPKRQVTNIDNLTVYHDSFGGNEDPYLWNKSFLHTYCHITQLINEEGQINFWISGDIFPEFNKLFCDCVFVIAEKNYWKERNRIEREDPIVDNNQTYEHHYKWVNPPHSQHPFKRRRRYTLKADPDKSFQPQDNTKNLIDIVPFLENNGIKREFLIKKITSKMGSYPFELEANIGEKLYDYLDRNGTIKIIGQQLQDRHPNWQNIKNESKGLTKKCGGC